MTRDTGAVRLYTMLDNAATNAATLVDAGCGRGAHLQHTRGAAVLRRRRADGARIVGLDIAAPAEPNPYLTEFHLITPDTPWPIDDNSVDVIFSDWVLEHVTNPTSFFTEAGRILKPGGHLIARTLQKWSIAGIGARTVPNRLHRPLIRILQPGMKPEDIFPTALKANTVAAITDLCRQAALDPTVEFCGGLDGYGGNNRPLKALLHHLERALPAAMRHTLLINARKKPHATIRAGRP